MPSLQVIDVPDEEAPNQSNAALESGIKVPVQASRKSKSTRKTQQRKITPTAEPMASAPAAKAKQQATLASFFSKSKFPSTPCAKSEAVKKKTAPASNVKELEVEQPKKAMKLTETEPSPTPLSALLTSMSTSKPRPKMDFKDIIVGKVSSRKLTSQSTSLSFQTDIFTASRDRRNDDLYALLPRIPPLSDVQPQNVPASKAKAGSTKDEQDTTVEKLQPLDESDECEEINAVGSQLVHKFENLPVTQHSRRADENVFTQDEAMELEVEFIKVEGGNAKSEPCKVGEGGDEDHRDVTQDGGPANDDLRPLAASDATQLDCEAAALLHRQEAMRMKYCYEASRLILQARNGFPEEEFEIAVPSAENISLCSSTEFPDEAVPILVCLVEGSKLPLSKLASTACEYLKEAVDGISLSFEIVSSKIKVLASRKPLIKNPEVASGSPIPSTPNKDNDVFENTNPDHLWRWEVTTLDLLPAESVKAVKGARSVRKKLQSHFNAIARLLAALNESIKLQEDVLAQQSQAKIDKVILKINREEEKVLKFEQETEKARLLAEAKKQKEALKDLKEKTEKKRQKEDKKKAAEERKREKEDAKQKKAHEKEEMKRLKEEKERQQQIEKEKAQEKQRMRMMSFFGGPAKVKGKVDEASLPLAIVASVTANSEKGASPKDGFDSEKFRRGINSLVAVEKSLLFSSLSKRATASRKRRTNHVKMRVFVSLSSADDPFAAPAFAEERIVQVRDRNKFLSFHEDCRPPYHGTWSKQNSGNRLGRRPFLKYPALNYDVDSEAEWEEGDDDPGEDVENDAGDDEDEKMLDEEGDTRVYNYQDGWLAQDDDIIKVDEADMDEATEALVKASKKLVEGVLVPVCIVAPAVGGVPVVEKFKAADDLLLDNFIEGFPAEDAFKLLSAHNGAILWDADLFLDAFPPVMVEDRDITMDASAPPLNQPSEEDMKTIAKFVHHSKLGSKSQLTDQLRNTHGTVTPSRAAAQRIIDSMVEKKRHPSDGVYWEVKQDIIDKLGLGHELKALVLPEAAKAPKKDNNKKRKKSEAGGVFVKSALKAKKLKTETGGNSTETKGSCKNVIVSAASVNVLAAFLVKKKQI